MTGFYALPFLLLVLSIFTHPGDGSSIIEKSLSFIVFPVCIFMSQYKPDKKETEKLLIVFIIGTIVLCIKGILFFVIVTSEYQYEPQHDFIFRYRHEFNTNTWIPPTYASIYLIFSIFSILLFPWKNKRARSILWMTLIFLGGNLMLLSAKMPILAFIFILVFLFVRKELTIPGLNKRWTLILFGIGLVGMISLLGFTRWNELITAFNYQSADPTENSVGIRGGINHCSFELAEKYYLWGTGPQNLQKELNWCYYQFEGNDFDRHEFNTHNQYFDYLLSSGLLGLAVLVLVMAGPLIWGFRHRDPLLISFALLMILCMLTENLLSRQAGIIFYCFFNAILLNRKRTDPL